MILSTLHIVLLVTSLVSCLIIIDFKAKTKQELALDPHNKTLIYFDKLIPLLFAAAFTTFIISIVFALI